MATYLLPAAGLCPALLVPASLLVPGTDPAPVASSLVAGDTTAVLTKLNANALRQDLVARRGGGGYAITEGLTLTAAALVCTVAAGQGLLDGVVTLAAAATIALADNAYNWIWLLQDGTLAKTSSATTTPPSAPAAACLFLGRIQVTAGTPGTPDYSGRLELRGGTLFRRTGDAGIPADTPSAQLQFVAQTLGGAYWWDGAVYRRMAEQFNINPTVIGASEAFVIPAGFQLISTPLTVSGTLDVAGVCLFL